MILGIDVSHYEPPVDWAKAKAGGVEWMYTKASEGINHKDVMLKAHANAAHAAQVLTGAYHFFHASLSGGVQADHFLSTIQGMKFDLPHVLDWESSSADGQSAEHQKLAAKAWLTTVESESGRAPIIYGGEAHLRGLGLDKSFERYPLWLAHYGVKEEHLHIPQPWSNYTMWQYTDAETVPGLGHGHHVDANWYKGSLDQLRSL